jgi:hypothetical protein
MSSVILLPTSSSFFFSPLHSVWEVTFSDSQGGMYSESFLEKWNFIADKLQNWALAVVFKIFKQQFKVKNVMRVTE